MYDNALDAYEAKLQQSVGYAQVGGDSLKDFINKQNAGLSGQALGLTATKKDLKSDVEGLVKRAHSIHQQVDLLFASLFGPIVEPCGKAEGRTPSIEGGLNEAYDILADVDSTLTTLVARVGGR